MTSVSPQTERSVVEVRRVRAELQRMAEEDTRVEAGTSSARTTVKVV